MSDPLSIPSTSSRYGLPLLFAGQAQKEFYINEAHARTDMLLHPAIEGVASAPPSDPQNGQSWLISGDASGEWAGHDGQIASFEGGTWLFLTPRDGLRVLDRSSMQDIFFRGGWIRAARPANLQGGTTVDAEARAAIGQLIAALMAGGILPHV